MRIFTKTIFLIFGIELFLLFSSSKPGAQEKVAFKSGAAAEFFYNFGKIRGRGTAAHTFRILNGSRLRWKVNDLVTSCECVSASLADENKKSKFVNPGQTLEIKVEVDTARHKGEFEQFAYLNLEAGGKRRVIRLVVRGYNEQSLLSSERVGADDKLVKEVPKDRPILWLSSESVDLGEVAAERGKVAKEIKIRNKGRSSLALTGITSSCACTSAKVIYNGQESPEFGMQREVKNWSLHLRPGEEATLRVIFDPNYHKVKGKVFRAVSIASNDPVHPRYSIQISAFVRFKVDKKG